MTKSSSGCSIDWVWNDPSYGADRVKPKPEIEGGRFPRTDYSFHSGFGGWGGNWSNDDGQFRRHNLGREYLIESARERAREMAVFAVILVTAAWPVIYMIVMIVQLYLKP
jgi:hypothetical protein